jgi:hypothetical protein
LNDSLSKILKPSIDEESPIIVPQDPSHLRQLFFSQSQTIQDGGHIDDAKDLTAGKQHKVKSNLKIAVQTD